MKILLVQTGFLGDVVLSTPVLPNLRTLFPQAQITVLTTPLAVPLVAHHPCVSSTIAYDKRGKDKGIFGLFRLAKQIRAERFDMAISIHKSYRTAVLLHLSRIPIRIGFAEARFPFLYTVLASRGNADHEVLRNLAILQAVQSFSKEAKVSAFAQPMHIGIPEFVKGEARSLLSGCENRVPIGIAPGSVWATKRWTAEGFADSAKALYDQGYAVVLLGGKDDTAVSQRIEQLAGVPCVNLVGKCNLLTSAAVISQLRLVITNDSSPLHMASATGTPVVAVFCATVPEFGYGPWHVPAEVVGVSDLACRPCGRHGGQTCPTGTHACQVGLTASSVLAAVRRVLDKTTTDKSSYKLSVISGNQPL